jgi:hypothetical protein
MKVYLALLLLIASTAAIPQLSFGTEKKPEVDERLGILGQTHLGGLSPTGDLSEQSQQLQNPSGRGPEGKFGGNQRSQCCCIPQHQQCGDLEGRDEEDLVGLGLIDQRVDPQIGNRIVNTQGSGSGVNQQVGSCPRGHKTCCFSAEVDLSVFGRNCVQPQQVTPHWEQRCSEPSAQGRNQCGVRSFASPVRGLQHGEASPGEFPWTCILLNQNNDFVGSCALIPSGSHNRLDRGAVKVITAAHKLKNLQEYDELIVRVGEYDASGFNPPEGVKHVEYTVRRILKHPEFSAKRLDNDIAILYTERNIVLNVRSNVNAACLPSCRDQFSYRFNNGTGTRCWVAGWGKDSSTGSFQFIQHKVDLALVDNQSCQDKLKTALNSRKRGSGDRFRLSDSEICAGGEVGKDACTGDGGSPLVCQAKSGRWTVVGLVTWGVGCASHIPGVYARVSHFQRWIDSN